MDKELIGRVAFLGALHADEPCSAENLNHKDDMVNAHVLIVNALITGKYGDKALLAAKLLLKYYNDRYHDNAPALQNTKDVYIDALATLNAMQEKPKNVH